MSSAASRCEVKMYTSALIADQKDPGFLSRRRCLLVFDGPRALANTTRQAMSCRVVFGWPYLPNVWNDIDYVA